MERGQVEGSWWEATAIISVKSGEKQPRQWW